MKKKLAAILSACLVLSAAFYSCGKDDDDDDDSSRRKSSSSISSEDSDPKYNENDDDEEPTTTEAVTTSTTVTTTATVTTTTSASSGHSSSGSSGGSSSSGSGLPLIPASEAPETSGGDIVGVWGGFESGEDIEGLLEFGSDGVGAMYADISSTMYFDDDGSVWMNGLTLGKDCVSYDGTTVRVTLDAASLGIDPSSLDSESAAMLAQDLIVLERTGSADTSTMDGEYRFNGGMLGDTLAEEMAEEYDSMNSDDLIAVISGHNFLIKIDNMFTYTKSGKTITMNSENAMFKENFDQTTVDFTVDGDTLYMYNVENDDNVLKLDRVTF